MNYRNLWRVPAVLVAAIPLAAAYAAPMTYSVDPGHTFPAFEADHWGGLSIWRGKINRTEGTIVLDKEAGTGTIDVTMDMASIDFGHDGMNERAIADIFHVTEYPAAMYRGRLVDFDSGRPGRVEGELTLHGVTRPVNLEINRFKCQPHFRTQIEVCGADASTTINRGDFGVDYDLANGFFPEVKLLITIEAQLAD